jgi:hypothetical protein
MLGRGQGPRWIEIKGYWYTKKQKGKIEEFSSNHNIKVLFMNDIEKLYGRCYQTFMYHWKKKMLKV